MYVLTQLPCCPRSCRRRPLLPRNFSLNCVNSSSSWKLLFLAIISPPPRVPFLRSFFTSTSLAVQLSHFSLGSFIVFRTSSYEFRRLIIVQVHLPRSVFFIFSSSAQSDSQMRVNELRYRYKVMHRAKIFVDILIIVICVNFTKRNVSTVLCLRSCSNV